MNPKLDLRRLYATALRINRIESRIAEAYPSGNMRCPVHLSIGQEIPSSIFEQVVTPGDTAISTHRAHAHYLAMGGNLSRMIAEIYGKATGCSKGRGGSMHLIDLEKGFLGSSAIVGNSIPIGVGVGYANHLSSNRRVSFIFLGDGAAEEGSFYESANFAAIHKLPVVFILENNLYSVYTNLTYRHPENRSLAELSKAIGLKTEKANDVNFQESFEKLRELTEYSRGGNGPTLLEISTYRTLEHCGPNDDDNLGYRPNTEIEQFKNVDLILRLERESEIPISEKNYLILKIDSEIDDAFNFAESSPFPSYSDVISGVYAN
jgi:pyruvate dehydrogenase E1 component alpha subunit